MHQYLLKTARYIIKYLLWQKIKLWLNFIQAELEVLFFLNNNFIPKRHFIPCFLIIKIYSIRT